MRLPSDYAAPKQEQEAIEYIWEQKGCVQQRREPIIRCRDCKNYKPYRTHQYGMMNRCHDEHGHTHRRDENDFCSRGERRAQ